MCVHSYDVLLPVAGTEMKEPAPFMAAQEKNRLCVWACCEACVMAAVSHRAVQASVIDEVLLVLWCC